MRIAFYAPMKPASSPVPSGDREMARNLIAALGYDHTVEIATEFVSRDGKGDPVIQRQLSQRGQDEARRLIDRWRDAGMEEQPEAWFTYHVYHKAPDWIGPAVSQALNIPYFMAEVSHAPKQAGGPWDIGYRVAESAIRSADGIIGLTELDSACVLPLLDDTGRYHRLSPFADITGLRRAAQNRDLHRKDIAERFELPDGMPVLLAVGMMRDGDKLASYRVLSQALAVRTDQDWTLVIVGDGPARADVEQTFANAPPDRIRFAGAVPREDLAGFYAAADLLVWPAVNEAYGMALLEAQATGLPVIAGDTGGVPDVVHHGETGLLCPIGDAAMFADAVKMLLEAPDLRDDFSRNALARTAAENDISAAAEALNRILQGSRKARAA